MTPWIFAIFDTLKPFPLFVLGRNFCSRCKKKRYRALCLCHNLIFSAFSSVFPIEKESVFSWSTRWIWNNNGWRFEKGYQIMFLLCFVVVVVVFSLQGVSRDFILPVYLVRGCFHICLVLGGWKKEHPTWQWLIWNLFRVIRLTRIAWKRYSLVLPSFFKESGFNRCLWTTFQFVSYIWICAPFLFKVHLLSRSCRGSMMVVLQFIGHNLLKTWKRK